MARIKTYQLDNVISDSDIVIGSDGDQFDRTKNYSVGDLRSYINAGLSPITGGTLKITTIVDNEDIQPHLYLNAKDPAIEVLQYEIVFFILAGKTWIFRKNNGVFGVGETQTVLSDFTFVDVSQSVPTPNLDEVLTAGNFSILNALVGDLGLYDPMDGYSTIKYRNGRFIFDRPDSSNIVTIDEDSIAFSNGVNVHVLEVPLDGNYVASFQNKTGVVAYLDDIINPNVQTITAGSGIQVNDLGDGEFEIVNTAQQQVPLYVTGTQIFNTSTSTVILSNGGELDIEEEMNKSAIQIRVVFTDDVVLTASMNTDPIAYLNVWRVDSDGKVYSDREVFSGVDGVTSSGSTLIIPNKKDFFLGDNVIKMTLSLVPNAVQGFYFDMPEYIKTWYKTIE
jgi:hypothetical protein